MLVLYNIYILTICFTIHYYIFISYKLQIILCIITFINILYNLLCVQHMQRNFKTIRNSAARKQSSNRGFHESFYNSPNGGGTGGAGGGDDTTGGGAGGDIQMTGLPDRLRPPAISTTRETGKSSPRAVQGTPSQHQSLHHSTPRAPANTPHVGYVGAVAVDVNDPILLEQQRQLYAQVQAQQYAVPQTQITPGGRHRGGRTVDVSPLGQQRPANYPQSSNSSVSTHSSYRQSVGRSESHTSTSRHSGRGVAVAGAGTPLASGYAVPPSPAVYSQQMYRTAGATDYPPNPTAQPVVNNYARINNRHHQQHLGSSSGSTRSTPRSSGGYEAVNTTTRPSTRSPRIDEDG